MLNFYKIVKENLNFNRFEFDNTVCLEYSCPIEADHMGIFSRSDYIVYVLSGKKTYQTIKGEWTLAPGQILYLKKGASIIHQFFDDEYCMLGFFISDDLIVETISELKGKMPIAAQENTGEFAATEVKRSPYLDGYFNSMLTYFRSEDRPPNEIIKLKLKELLINILNSDPRVAAYFKSLVQDSTPSLPAIMEANYCYNLKLEDFAELTHRSLSTFKRDFQKHYDQTPGKWLLEKRIEFATNLLLSTDLSVSQVAFESGFEDLSHFSRAFKGKIGLNPSEFRKKRTSE